MKNENVVAALAVITLILVAVAGCAKKTTQVAQPAAPEPTLQRIHFDFDKYNIKPEYVPILEGNAKWIKNHSNAKVVIEGHCDERGTVEYNIALGDRRARAAKEYLINLGVDPNRLSTISYGEEKPIATCHDESCWWQNRRAEFVAK